MRLARIPAAPRRALRALARRPRWTAFAVVGLAVGIGFQTAAFSVFYANLLRPSPIPEVDRLFLFFETEPGAGAERLNLSRPAFLAWQSYQAKSSCFDGASGSVVALTQLTSRGGPEPATALLVTPSYFEVLGVPAAHGRTLAHNQGPQPEVVLADALWRERFGADPAILGRDVRIGESLFTVVGILPRNWGGSTKVQLWLPLSAARRLFPQFPDLLEDPGRRILRAQVRLAANCSAAAARARLALAAPRLAAERPAGSRDIGVSLVPYREGRAAPAATSLLFLQAGGLLVLLLVVANLANLLLAQAQERRREMAIRAALGAAPGRLLRQLLAETLLIAGLGGVLGLGVAHGLLRALTAEGEAVLPNGETPRLELPVLGATLFVTVAAGLAAGLGPALRNSWRDPDALLRDEPRGVFSAPIGPLRRLARSGLSGLLVAETALTVTLLLLAGLLLRSERRLEHVELGFEPEGVLVLSVSLPGERYPDRVSLEHFFEAARREIAALPGVESVAAAADLPLEGTSCSRRIVSGTGLTFPAEREIACAPVTLDYRRTLRFSLLRGRDFEPPDYRAESGSVLLNRRAAAALWPGQDPLGKTLTFDDGGTVRIVGVVADIRHLPPDRDPRPVLYLPTFWNNMSFLIRTADPPRGLLEAARKAVWRVDPRQPIYASQTLPEVLRRALAGRRARASLSLILAGVALLIGAFGLYAVTSHRLAGETRSLAVRAALGATPGRLLPRLLARGLLSTAVGAGVGLLLAAALSRFTASLLFGVSPLDPWTHLCVIALTLATAALATYGPARRALARDPAVVLRRV